MESGCAQIARNMRRDIKVSDDEVRECVQVSVFSGAVLDDLDDAFESFGDGVLQIVLAEGADVGERRLEGADERAQQGDAGAQSGGHLGAEELLNRRLVLISSKYSVMILQYPSAMNTAIGMAQANEGTGPSLGAPGRVPVQQLAQAIDRLALRAGRNARSLVGQHVDSLVEGFGDVEVIDDECGVRVAMHDRLGIGTDHVATDPADLVPLVPDDGFAEEPVDYRAILSRADPHHVYLLKIINGRSELAHLALGNLIPPDVPQAQDSMSVARADIDPMQQVRHRRAGPVRDRGGFRVRHVATEHAAVPFAPVGNPCMKCRPGNLLRNSPVYLGLEFPGADLQRDIDSNEGQNLLGVVRARVECDRSMTVALRKAVAAFIRREGKVQISAVVLERERSELHAVQSLSLAQQLQVAHGSSLLCRVVRNRREQANIFK